VTGIVSRLCRLPRVLALLAALLVFTVAAPAIAHEGEAVGWEVESATEEIVVGRMVLHYDPELEDDAMELAKNLPAWWSDIERELAGDLDDRLELHFVKYSGRVAEATRMPQWAAGVANPPRGEVIIAQHRPDGSPSDLEALLRHELVHVALYRATDGAKLPRWFHEGVADSVGDEISLLRAETMASTVFGAGVPPLDEINQSFRGEGREVSVAYAASRDFATYLRYRDGEGTDFRQLLTQLRQGHSFRTSFINAYGAGLEELEGEWRGGLAGRFAWYPVIGGGGLPFALFAPAIGFAWWRRRRTMRAAWARLDREDQLERERRVGMMGPAHA
jgi:hypothetical protein